MSMSRIITGGRMLPNRITVLRSSPLLLSRPFSASPFHFQQLSPIPSSSLDPSSSQQQPRDQPIKKKSTPTALFYRNLLPSMLHCLALGSIIYYALELLHNYLDAELIQEELEGRILLLEGELEGLRRGESGKNEVGKAGGSWWKIW